ncbi:MAG: preprotein translocase subunit SecE [Actinomycetota bacterium]
MVNRATKRLMAKQERAQGRGGAGGGGQETARGDDDDRRRSRPARLERKKRTPPRQFLKEVRSELRKVAWPNRREVSTYTVVVLISVLFVTLLVFALDYGLDAAVAHVFNKK